MRPNFIIRLFLIPGLTIAMFAGKKAVSAERSAHLQKWLAGNPGADANGAGILTGQDAWDRQAEKIRRNDLKKAAQARARDGKAATKDASRKPAAVRARREPAFRDVRYDPSLIDVYPAKSEKPTPLVVFYHGGGWRGRDKREVSAIKHLTAAILPGPGIHHPVLGPKLKIAMDAFGIECIHAHAVDLPGDPQVEMVDFSKRHLLGGQ